MFANRFYPGDYEVTDRSLKSTPEGIKRSEMIKSLNKLKKESDILRYGETVWINSYDEECIISFKRCLDGKEIVFIGNTKNRSYEINFDSVPQNILFSNSIFRDNKLLLGPYQYIVYTK